MPSEGNENMNLSATQSASTDPAIVAFGPVINNSSTQAQKSAMSFYDIAYAEGLMPPDQQQNLANGVMLNNNLLAYGGIGSSESYAFGAHVLSEKMSMTAHAKRNLKQWRVQWYPTGDIGELDGTEASFLFGSVDRFSLYY